MKNSIEKLLIKCNLGELINEPIRIEGGLLNRMYKVETTTGIYAIKLLNSEVMTRENARDNHIFAENVSNIAKNSGVNCIPAKIINTEIIQNIDEHYFLIYDWFDGKVVSDFELTIEHTKKVAKELATLHQIDFDFIFDKCKAYYDTHIIDWDYYIDKIENIEIKQLLESNKERFHYLDVNSIDYLNKISDNMVISHRDLDLPNILWDENENPVIIDWESSGLVNPCMELIDTAWNWSGGQNYFDKEKYQTFIKVYVENGGSLDDYDAALIADFKAKFGWLEYNLKRICDIECIDEEEKELGRKETIRTFDEIKKFDLYSMDMLIQ